MLVDEGEAEAGAFTARALAGADAAGEALEDQRAFLDRHARTVVLDGDLDVGQHIGAGVAVLDADLRFAGAVGEGVVDEVGDDAGQPTAVATDDRLLGATRRGNLQRRGRRHGDGVAHELADPQILEVKTNRSGVEAADLEEVLDESAEPGDVADQQIERRLGPLGHLVAPCLHHVDRRRQRHQRRTQLVGDVRREPGIALDSLLQRRGHVVERTGEHAEVGIVGRCEPGLQASAGDRLGGLGGVGDRTHGAAGCEHADEHAEAGRDRRREQQRQGDVGERLVVVLEAEELEVVGVDANQADADDLERLAVDLGDHPCIDVVGDHPLAQ